MKLIIVGSAMAILFLLLAFFGIRHYKVVSVEKLIKPRLSGRAPKKKKMKSVIGSAFNNLWKG